MFLSNYNGINN